VTRYFVHIMYYINKNIVVRYKVLIALTEDCCVLGCDATSKVLVYQTAVLHFRQQQSS
jgi:hypothetical protein